MSRDRVKDVITDELEELSAIRGQDSDLSQTVGDGEKEFTAQYRKNKLAQNVDIHCWRKYSLIVLFAYLCVWSIVILLFVFFYGIKAVPFNCCPYGFSMSDPVIITLLTTTLAQVIGVTAIAFKWLFPKDSSR